MLKINTFNKKRISILLLILGVSLFICAKQFHTYDYWWHIKVGEYIVGNRSIPYNGIFSWYGLEENLPWYSHEWLSEVLIFMFSLIKNGGYVFIVCFTLLLFLILYKLNKIEYTNNYIFASIWIVIGGFILFPVILPRPHMISYIFLAITMYILKKYIDNENFKYIWLIPIISLLWSNFHGGSSNLPYVLTFIVLFTSLFDFKISKIIGKRITRRQLKTLIIIIITSILLIAINPHGFDMVLYPYSNMNDSYMLSIISEWRCPDLKNISDYPIFIEIALIVFVFIFTKKNISLTDFILSGAFIYLSFKSVRFSALLYIITTFFIFKYINLKEYHLKPKVDNLVFKSITGIGVMGIFFYIIIFPTIIKEPLAKNIPDNIIELIKQENPMRLYNDYDFGGYLINKDIDVFVDGRADLYSKYNLKDAINLEKLNDNPKDIIDKYNFDLYVIHNNSPLAYYFKNNNNFIKLQEDNENNIVIFKPIK